MAEVVITLSLGLTMFVNVAMLKIQEDLRDVVDVVYDDTHLNTYTPIISIPVCIITKPHPLYMSHYKSTGPS